MDHSIRSSAPRVVEYKLRKTDQSLHETTQRFVERLLTDIRISQYSDLNNISGMIGTGKWCFLNASEKGRVGFLVIQSSKSPVVWMDERGKASYIIPMRIHSTFSDKGCIIISSLDIADGLLRIEDIKYLGGEDLRAIPFTGRWQRLLDFYRDSYIYDAVLQKALRIEPAKYMPISSINEWGECPPNYIYAQHDTMVRRFRVQCTTPDGLDLSKNLLVEVPDKPVQKPVSLSSKSVSAYQATINSAKATLAQKQRQMQPFQPANQPPYIKQQTHAKELPQPQVKQPQVKQLHQVQAKHLPQSQAKQPQVKVQPKTPVILAIPNDAYPDTYTITINGDKKGYAAVQDIELSKILRDACKTRKELPVKAEWNNEFSSYEIISLI